MGNIIRRATKYKGKPVTFAYTNPKDVVQRHLHGGRFFEQSDLEAHAKLIPYSGIVIDVGANIGNHTLYYSLFSRAAKVYPMEPNPTARVVLTENIRLNGVEKVDLSFVEYGAGEKEMKAAVVSRSKDNLGSAHLRESEDGIQVKRLDTLFSDITPIFIKIDVEGMELSVLSGAKELIRRSRPHLAIEIANENKQLFWKWCATEKYHVIDAFQGHKGSINYLAISMR